jgi:hypothetical protein
LWETCPAAIWVKWFSAAFQKFAAPLRNERGTDITTCSWHEPNYLPEKLRILPNAAALLVKCKSRMNLRVRIYANRATVPDKAVNDADFRFRR